MAAKTEPSEISGRRLLAFLLIFTGGMVALVLCLHLARAGSFERRQVQFVESRWTEKPIRHRSTVRHVTVLSVWLVDGDRRATVEIKDTERAQAFVNGHLPASEVPLWVSPDASQLHPPSVLDLLPYSLGLFIAAIPVAMLSALMAFVPGRKRYTPSPRGGRRA
jgi:hypothetical protein